MVRDVKLVEVFKLDDTEFNALEIISKVNCDGVACNDCPFAIAGQRCIIEQAATIIANNTEVQ